jgi:hypothetical protein
MTDAFVPGQRTSLNDIQLSNVGDSHSFEDLSHTREGQMWGSR